MDSISEFCGYLRYEAGRSPLTIEAYERDLREFATFIEGDGHPDTFNPESVTLSDVRSWVAYLGDPTGAGDAAATLRRKVQSLRAFFRFLMKRHRRLDNPAAQLTLPRLARHLPDFIKAAEMEKILSDDDPATNPEALPEEIRNHLIIDILYSTGMRQAELLSLTDDDIFASHGELRVTGKRGKTRILPLPLPLHRRILRWQSVRDSIYHDLPEPRPLIATRHGSMSKSTLYSIVKRMLAPAATGRKSPHTLRHTFATAMLNGGGQLTDVKELLGHESLSTTQIYTHVSFAEIRSAYSHSHPRAGAASTPSHTTKKETSEKKNREE